MERGQGGRRRHLGRTVLDSTGASDLRETEMDRDTASLWRSANVNDLLAESARAIGAGNPTDAGVSWTLPTKAKQPIALAGGIPDPATLPVECLQKALDHVLAETPREALRYGGVQGYDGLRLALAERQSHLEGVHLGPENFIVTNGSAGALENICRAFVGPGDVVVVEGPTFSGSIRTFRGHMAELVQLPMDDEGLRIDRLREVVQGAEASAKKVKLVYTIPDFHNPTGTTMSLERRMEMLRLCAEHRALVVEDAAYTEIQFGHEAPPSLYALSTGEGVLKMGTFSKSIATGLRIGWVQGRADFIQALTKVRFDMGNSPLLQRALAEVVNSGELDAHLERARPLYALKCDTLCRSLEEHCRPYVRFKKPAGGFFLWLQCLGPSARDVTREAAAEGLIFPAGDIFFLRREQDDSSHVRLAFSTASVEELAQVGPRLKAAFARAMGEGPAKA